MSPFYDKSRKCPTRDIAKAKDAKDIDAAVNLAATCKRLLSLIDEADKLSK